MLFYTNCIITFVLVKVSIKTPFVFYVKRIYYENVILRHGCLLMIICGQSESFGQCKDISEFKFR